MTENKKTAVKSAVSGLLAGALNGFFGGGGGMLLVPLLTKWVKIDEKSAFATSVMIILPLCAVSAAVYFFRGSLEFMEALPYLIGGGVGGAVAGRFFKNVPVKLLRRALALLIIVSGVKTLLWP